MRSLREIENMIWKEKDLGRKAGGKVGVADDDHTFLVPERLQNRINTLLNFVKEGYQVKKLQKVANLADFEDLDVAAALSAEVDDDGSRP